MESPAIKILARISLLIVFYLFLYHLYMGVITKPFEGDSLINHIPIAKTIINGSFIDKHRFPPHSGCYPYDACMYYPGANESILAVFMILHIPLGLFNVLAFAVLFFACYFLARHVGLLKSYAIIFASSIVTNYVIVRWLLTQKIDIWMTIFFVTSLILLKKPKSSLRYFFLTGASFGMLFGSKHFGFLFLGVLLVVFGKNLLSKLTVGRGIALFIPFTFLGLSWYIRNYLFTGDPLYPMSFLFFKGEPGFSPFTEADFRIWHVLSYYPTGTFNLINAFISEYKIWAFAPLSPLLYLWLRFKHGVRFDKNVTSIVWVSLLIFAIVLYMPVGIHANETVSYLRYSISAFICFILAVFLMAKSFKKEELISYVAMANMIIMPPLIYSPKLIVFILVGIGIFYLRPGKLKKLLAEA